MSTDPDEIREDIERTRTELSRDVDALADKVSPTQVAQRQADKVRSAVFGRQGQGSWAARPAVPITPARRRPPSATRRPASARRRRVFRTRPRTRPAGTRWRPG